MFLEATGQVDVGLPDPRRKRYAVAQEGHGGKVPRHAFSCPLDLDLNTRCRISYPTTLSFLRIPILDV